jgi:hypothetical protein
MPTDVFSDPVLRPAAPWLGPFSNSIVGGCIPMKSLKSMLALLVAAGVGALLLMSGLARLLEHQQLADVERSFVAKDIAADILPPPMYLIELRLVLSRLADGTLDLAAARTETERLRKEYLDRAAHAATPPRPPTASGRRCSVRSTRPPSVSWHRSARCWTQRTRAPVLLR